MSVPEPRARYRNVPSITGGWTEKRFLEQVRQLARLAGWATYHTHNSRRSEPGFPDLVLVKPPRVLFRELKSQRGRLRPEQRLWLEALRACGLDADVWRPSDWERIAATLMEEDR